MGHDSTMSDDLPRPYADEPAVEVAPSGLRLVRARPWAVAATVLLTVVLTLAYPLITVALVRSGEYVFEMGPVFLLPALGAIPTFVPLTMIAVLVRRRVTVGRALGLLGTSIVLITLHSLLISILPYGLVMGGDLWIRWLLWPAVEALMLAGLGASAAALYPPVDGRNEAGVLVLASVVAGALSHVLSWLRPSELDVMPELWSPVQAVVTVGWAIAVLVTSRPAAPGWAGTPAELGRQDP
jgi:hypothetical protein